MESTVARVPPEGADLGKRSVSPSNSKAHGSYNLLEFMDSDGDVPRQCPQVLTHMLCEGPGTQIRRRRLNSNLREHESAARLGRLLILFDHAADPGKLAGAVEVVSPGLGTDFEDLLSIDAVRPDRGDEDTCLLNQSPQALFAVHVGELDRCWDKRVSFQRPTVILESSASRSRRTWLDPVGVQLLALVNHILELPFGTTSNGPFQIGWEMSRDVFRGQLTGVAWNGSWMSTWDAR